MKAKRRRGDACLGETGGACSPGTVKAVRDRARAMIADAASMLGGAAAGKYPECERRLVTAREALSAAEKVKGNRSKRDALIRATFHAGQARVCPLTAGLSRKVKTKKGGKRRG